MTEDLDISGLKERYAAERARRIRKDGNDQFIRTTGQFAGFTKDPWATRDERDSRRITTEVMILGGGFAGMLVAAQLRKHAIDDVVIVERAGDFGGTWYWNRYPGAACDTESYIYLPLLEETGYMPGRKYATGQEIFEHCKRIGQHFDLYKNALFHTSVTSIRWDDEASVWHTKTDRGDTILSRFVVIGAGPLARPKLPGVPGIESFAGESFHTSRWNFDYTGGNRQGNLVGLADKRVGLIGTGASAIQCVPHLGQSAQQLFVFQRTPSAVCVRADQETDPDWVNGLEPGWQRALMDNFSAVVSGEEFETDLVDDGWTDVLGGILLAPLKTGRKLTKHEFINVLEQADFGKMNELRNRIDAVVADESTAEALKPWYKAFCKRPCFHDEYLSTFNRPNVHLIDTGGQGVERITSRGVVVAGQEYELDCLIYSTGFEIGQGYASRLSFDICGRIGMTLADKWEPGARTLHGFMTRDFPNCLIISTVQAGQSPNMSHMIDEQSRHIAYLIHQARERDAVTIEPTAEAEERWTQEVVQAAQGRNAYHVECTPGYYNNEGHFDERIASDGPYWRSPLAFIRVLEDWRERGDLEGLEIVS